MGVGYDRCSGLLFGQGQPFLSCDAADMFSPVVLQELVVLVFLSVMMAKATLGLRNLRLGIVGKVAAPQGLQLQRFKSVSHHFAHGLGDQALAPVGDANPIGNFAFFFADLEVAVLADQDADATDSPAIIFVRLSA